MRVFAHLVPVSSDFLAQRAARREALGAPARGVAESAAPTQLGKKFA
jgi:hypothetical protein